MDSRFAFGALAGALAGVATCFFLFNAKRKEKKQTQDIDHEHTAQLQARFNSVASSSKRVFTVCLTGGK
jgi:hypothetical protein